MLKLASATVAGAFALALAPFAAGAPAALQKCKAVDKAGNWEVVIGHASSKSAAAKIVSQAATKGLKATAERLGCSKRYEVVMTEKTRAMATQMQAKARTDGFTSASIQKS